MANELTRQLVHQYWKLAVHSEMAMRNEVRLDSPTVAQAEIDKSNDEMYKSLAPNLGKIAYDIKGREQIILAKINESIETLISQGANPKMKKAVIEDYFKSSLELSTKKRNSKSYCPVCKNLNPEAEMNFKCKFHPGKEHEIYNCPDFEDTGCMKWEKHYEGLDTEIKISHAVLDEILGKSSLEKDYRINQAVQKYINKLK